MPATSRAFVRVSILYLCLGAIFGALMFIQRFLPLGAWVGYLRVSHIVMLIVGWLTQLILGVAWWLFPPLQIGLRGDSPQPICEPLFSLTKIGLFGALIGLSGILLFVAAISFTLNMWGRVRQLGRPK